MQQLYRAHELAVGSPKTGVFPNPYQSVARRPLTTPQWMHQAADEWFRSNFGANFRSRAIFATGNMRQAKKFLKSGSEILSIWPVGPYQLCYSPKVYDLFDTLVNRFVGETPSAEEIGSEMKLLGYCLYESQGLHEAAASQCEVMLVASEYDYRTVSPEDYKDL